MPARAAGEAPPPGQEPAVTGVSTIVARFAGIPARGMVLGRPEAPVRITLYADLACPFCAVASPTLVRRVVRRYVRPGRATIRLRLLAFVAPSSRPDATATYAAAAQGMAWPFAAAVLANQGLETPAGTAHAAPLEPIAARLGLDLDRWRADMAAPETGAMLGRDERRADADHVVGVPTLVVAGPRGRRTIVGSVGIRRFAVAYAAVAPRPRRQASSSSRSF